MLSDSPHWEATCDRADISHFHGLCWWFLWACDRSPSPQTPTCSLWCQTCHTWLHWLPQSWQWQSPCGHGDTGNHSAATNLAGWMYQLQKTVLSFLMWNVKTNVNRFLCSQSDWMRKGWTKGYWLFGLADTSLISRCSDLLRSTVAYIWELKHWNHLHKDQFLGITVKSQWQT